MQQEAASVIFSPRVGLEGCICLLVPCLWDLVLCSCLCLASLWC